MVTRTQIGKTYSKAVEADDKARAIAKKARSYSAAQQYAEEIGKVASKVLLENDDIDWDNDDDLEGLVLEVMRRAHGDASGLAVRVQRYINADADIGLSALQADFDMERALGLSEELINGRIALDMARNMIINNVMHSVDETARKNMEAHEAVGLSTHIVRTYDDVGVHNRTEPCQWCLDREGEWTKYKEAYDAGVFQRHPGCGCKIDYHVGKTHTIQEGQSRRWRAV